MDIIKNAEGTTLNISLVGRLDTTTAPEFEKSFNESVEGMKDVVLNFEKLDYVSSAGLRVLLTAQKKMNAIGSMKLVNVKEDVMEVFEITGFSEILTIE